MLRLLKSNFVRMAFVGIVLILTLSVMSLSRAFAYEYYVDTYTEDADVAGDDDAILVPDTGGFTGFTDSAISIGIGIFIVITIVPVIMAVSIERRCSKNKIKFDRK